MRIRNVFWNWTLHCALGELLGFGAVGVLAGGYMALFGEPQTSAARLGFLALMVVAGSIEGGLLGYFQSRALRRIFWRLSPNNWIGLTVAVAVAGWLLGMLPSTFITGNDASATGPDLVESPWAFLALSAVAGLVVGALFGGAQAIELRRHTRRADRWVWANALGWAVALSVLYVVASLPGPDTPTWQILLLGGVGGVVAGLLLGLITGLFLQSLRRHRHPRAHTTSPSDAWLTV